MLRKIFEPNVKEVREEYRTLHNEELQKFFTPHQIINKVTESRGMRWGQACGMYRKDLYAGFL